MAAVAAAIAMASRLYVSFTLLSIAMIGSGAMAKPNRSPASE